MVRGYTFFVGAWPVGQVLTSSRFATDSVDTTAMTNLRLLRVAIVRFLLNYFKFSFFARPKRPLRGMSCSLRGLLYALLPAIPQASRVCLPGRHHLTGNQTDKEVTVVDHL